MLTHLSKKKYIKKMESDKKIFVKWLKESIKVDGLITGKELAAKVGVDPSTISGYFTGKSEGPKLPLRLKICEVMGVDHNKTVDNHRRVISARQSADNVTRTPPTTNIHHIKNPKEEEHIRIIQSFDDQDKAIRANKCLSSIEKLSKVEYIQVVADIEKKYEKLKERKASRQGALGGEKESNGTDGDHPLQGPLQHLYNRYHRQVVIHDCQPDTARKRYP